MGTKKVAAAIIRSDEKILLTRRKSGEKLAVYWEFPGCKIEQVITFDQTNCNYGGCRILTIILTVVYSLV